MKTIRRELESIELHLQDEVDAFMKEYPYFNPLGNSEQRALAKIVHYLYCALADLRSARDITEVLDDEPPPEHVDIGGEG